MINILSIVVLLLWPLIFWGIVALFMQLGYRPQQKHITDEEYDSAIKRIKERFKNEK